MHVVGNKQCFFVFGKGYIGYGFFQAYTAQGPGILIKNPYSTGATGIYNATTIYLQSIW